MSSIGPKIPDSESFDSKSVPQPDTQEREQKISEAVKQLGIIPDTAAGGSTRVIRPRQPLSPASSTDTTPISSPAFRRKGGTPDAGTPYDSFASSPVSSPESSPVATRKKEPAPKFTPDTTRINQALQDAGKARVEAQAQVKQKFVNSLQGNGYTHAEDIVNHEQFAGGVGAQTIGFVLGSQNPGAAIVYVSTDKSSKLMLAFKNEKNEIEHVEFGKTNTIEDMCSKHNVTLLKASTETKNNPHFQGFSYVNLLRVDTVSVKLTGVGSKLDATALIMLELVQKEELSTPAMPQQNDFSTTARDKYSNVKAYKHNMVPCAKTAQNWAGYLNASFIAGADRLFLACQGPLQERGIDTVPDLWSAVISNNSELILSLGPSAEGVKTKYSDNFFLDNATEPLKVSTSFGDCSVAKPDIVTEKKVFDGEPFEVIIRTYEVTMPGDKKITIQNCQCISWSDMAAIPPRALAQVMDYIKESSGPVTVHCSAGIGRTGTVISAYEADRKIEQGATSLPLGSIVTETRAGRMGCVQTPEQLSLIANYAQYSFQQKKAKEAE